MHDSSRGKLVLGISERFVTSGPHTPEGLVALDARATPIGPFRGEPGW